jgi:hypothetical protein
MKAKPATPSTNGDVARRHAVLYARVSSKDQEKEGFSIPSQERLLRNYALATTSPSSVNSWMSRPPSRPVEPASAR